MIDDVPGRAQSRDIEELVLHVCPNPVFVVGCPRSGTTILAWSLAQHSGLSLLGNARLDVPGQTTGETHLLFDVFRQKRVERGLDRVRNLPRSWTASEGVLAPDLLQALGVGLNALLTSRSSGPRWIDHTPHYLLVADSLAEAFPGAKFVHITRDAKRVVNSMVNVANWAKRVEGEQRLPPDRLPNFVDFKTACATWREHAWRGFEFASRYSDRCITVSLETLGQRGQDEFGRILTFLDLEWEQGPVEFFSSNRVNSSFPSGSRPREQDPWDVWPPELRALFAKSVLPTQFELGMVTRAELIRMVADSDLERARAIEAARYWGHAERVRSILDNAVPQGASLLAICENDDESYAIPGRNAWRFPSDSEGNYLGNPSDGEGAIRALELLRRVGRGEFLAVIGEARWWFEYYRSFADHLYSHYRVIPGQSSACTIFDLRA